MQHAISQQLIEAQDDNDSVVLPNACPGELIEMDGDSGIIRCFSILTKQPHVVPPERWSLIHTPQLMPSIPGQKKHIIDDRFLTDHVTRGIIGDNAIQLNFDDCGALRSLRLLPPGNKPAQEQWEAQAKRMIE